jgi:hypothetical protein
MGMLSALAMTDEELGMSLEEQIGLHFVANCYPKVPAYMVAPAIEALDAYNSGERFKQIKLPEGVYFKNFDSCSAYEMIDGHRLWAWVVESEMD